jgi:3-oxoacyl-[acyl-carrier protein] reductase
VNEFRFKKMAPGLKGSVAFVAGASSGLGRASAEALVAAGARVAICSRNEDRIHATALEIAEGYPGAEVLPIVCDVTAEDQIERAMEEVSGALGPLNILVTNAGGPPTGTIKDFDATQWEEALRLNLMSTINLCRHALPHVEEAAQRENGFGRIIIISSISAKQPIPTLYLSNVSRAGVQGFAKSLAGEVGVLGITVNTVLPGYTRTARLSHLSDALSARSGKTVDEIEAGWAEGTALKRIGTESEFGATVAFLASRGAGYITGVALPIDGGAIKGLF